MSIEIKKHYNHFFQADLHLGHEGICHFLRDDGTKLRPWNTAEEMDEELIKRHNSVVRPFDVVYFLGDVLINKKFFPKLARFNGRKRLVSGNHDLFATEEYFKYFERIDGVKVLSDMVLSHVPLHPESITQRWNCNVHGHTHYRSMNSPVHVCVSMEQIDYTPISLEDLRKRIQLNKEKYDPSPTCAPENTQDAGPKPVC